VDGKDPGRRSGVWPGAGLVPPRGLTDRPVGAGGEPGEPAFAKHQLFPPGFGAARAALLLCAKIRAGDNRGQPGTRLFPSPGGAGYCNRGDAPGQTLAGRPAFPRRFFEPRATDRQAGKKIIRVPGPVKRAGRAGRQNPGGSAAIRVARRWPDCHQSLRVQFPAARGVMGKGAVSVTKESGKYPAGRGQVIKNR